MLASFRRFAKTPVATFIAALAMLGFLFVGGRSMFSAASTPSNAVIKAGARTVTADDFRQIFQRVLQQQQQKSGQTVTVPDAVKNDLDLRLLDEMSQEEALAAWIARTGVRPSDELVAAELRKQPQFFNPVSGVFDKKAYNDLLAQNGLTATKFEADLRDQIAQTQVLSGMVAGLRAPAAYAALEAAYGMEQRAFTYFALPVSSVPAPAQPTNAELQTYMKAHAADLQTPATRQVSLVRFSASLLAPAVTVDPAAVQKRYDFEKDTLSTPEQRTFVQIPAASPAQAAAVADRLKAGADPAEAAKAAGAAAPTPYVDTPKTAVPDAGVANATFAMQPGEVRTVQGSLGLTVLKLSTVKPGHQVSFAEARPKVEAEVRQQAAAAKASQQMQAYDDARNGGADFAEAAKRAGVTPTVLGPFDAQGRDAKGQTVPAPQKLVQSAFALAPGATGDIQDAAPGRAEYYAIRVDKAAPAAPMTLDAIRAPLVRQLQVEALAKALRDKADSLAARVRKGEPIAAVARSAGQSPVTASLSRTDGQAAVAQYGQQMLGVLFGAKAGEVAVAPDPKAQGYAVIHLDAVRPAPAAQVARAAQAQQAGATQALYQDLAVHARAAAAALIKPKVNAAAARKSLGVDIPLPTAAGGAAPAKP